MDRYLCKLIGLLLLLVPTANSDAQPKKAGVEYGLQFASHEVSKDHRTSLNLNPEVPFYFNDDLEIRFDLSFRRLNNAYGYILRIIGNDSLNIDLLSSPSHDEFYDLNLIVNNSQTSVHYDFSEIGLKASQWTELVIRFLQREDQISVSVDGHKKVQDFPVSKLRTFRFFFGANDFGRFNTKDVPPIEIRDISIVEANKVIRNWPLRDHGSDKVYDRVAQAPAAVENPVWLIDKHTRWVHRKELVVDKYPSVAFNRQAGTLYLSGKRNLTVLDVKSGRVSEHPYQKGNPVYTDANQLIYVAEKDALINYDLQTNTFSRFDFSNNTWHNQDTTYTEPDYWHHNKFYNPVDSALYVFGGYGHFSYKNNFFRYDTAAEKWVVAKTTGSIPPRYLSAAGMMPTKHKALIFGGYGSVSGKQELFPQSFYDLYSFDLKTYRIDKLWEMPAATSSEDQVFANNMVINEADSCFYVLSFPKNKYNSYIQLRQYGISRPHFEILADSIPFQFHDEDAFSDLFLSDATQELIAVTSHKEGGRFKVNVYAINYPPLRPGDVVQRKTPENHAALYFALMGCGVLGMLALYALVRKHKRKTAGIGEDGVPETVGQSDDPALSEEKVVSTINLFGGFCVFNVAGHDVTAKFTATLKELFLLILLHSIKFEKGISAIELQEYLWPDKDEVSARNNRNVNIKKLRSLLSEIGSVTITNNNSYLQLSLGSDVHCDYQSVSKILNSVSPSNQVTPAQIKVILAQIKRGSLLPNLQATWLDNFKSDISNRIIDLLLEYSVKLDAGKDDKILIEIADAIFNYDSINQEALIIKCSVLNKKGKYALAKRWYEHFVREYKSLYAENYPKTFEEVIS